MRRADDIAATTSGGVALQPSDGLTSRERPGRALREQIGGDVSMTSNAPYGRQNRIGNVSGETRLVSVLQHGGARTALETLIKYARPPCRHSSCKSGCSLSHSVAALRNTGENDFCTANVTYVCMRLFGPGWVAQCPAAPRRLTACARARPTAHGMMQGSCARSLTMVSTIVATRPYAACRSQHFT